MNYLQHILNTGIFKWMLVQALHLWKVHMKICNYWELKFLMLSQIPINQNIALMMFNLKIILALL